MNQSRFRTPTDGPGDPSYFNRYATAGKTWLQLKDAPFDQPVMSRYISDATLKMLSYLVVLMDPDPPRFIGVEEPENFFHPRLLPELAEECRAATERSQLLATTHSPFFLNGAKPDEVRVIHRDEKGYSQITRAVDIYFRRLDFSGWHAARRKPSSRWSDSRRRKSSATGIMGIAEFVQAGASMGHLWLEGHLGGGYPLVNAGAPAQREGH